MESIRRSSIIYVRHYLRYAITDFVMLDLNYAEWIFLSGAFIKSFSRCHYEKQMSYVVITLQIRITLLRQHA